MYLNQAITCVKQVDFDFPLGACLIQVGLYMRLLWSNFLGFFLFFFFSFFFFCFVFMLFSFYVFSDQRSLKIETELITRKL